MLRWLAMLALCAALAASATWAASRGAPDAALPQPAIADAPEVIAKLPCSPLKAERLRVASRQLTSVVFRLYDLEQTPQVQRVLAVRGEQLTLVNKALRATERDAARYPCSTY
jgi:hypothetical protein